jgi:hydrogenase maturation factor
VSVPLFIAQELGHTLIGENVWMPTVTIDASQSPEVADLARVHAVEGIGDVSTHAIRQGDSVVVGVQLTSPVQAMFAVAFSFALHRDFLNEVANAISLTFATTDTGSAHEEQPLWLSVDIDGDALRQIMNLDVD